MKPLGFTAFLLFIVMCRKRTIKCFFYDILNIMDKLAIKIRKARNNLEKLYIRNREGEPCMDRVLTVSSQLDVLLLEKSMKNETNGIGNLSPRIADDEKPVCRQT